MVNKALISGFTICTILNKEQLFAIYYHFYNSFL